MRGWRHVPSIPGLVESLPLRLSHSLENFYLGRRGLRRLLRSMRGRGKLGTHLPCDFRDFYPKDRRYLKLQICSYKPLMKKTSWGLGRGGSHFPLRVDQGTHSPSTL